jgi:biotin synthase
MDVDEIVAGAEAAKLAGATRFCLGTASRSPTDGQVGKVCGAVRAVRDLGLETCVTLGMLTFEQASRLAEAAGLDCYNRNLDTSPGYYGQIIATRTYEDRLGTPAAVRAAGFRVCCGGTVGMGESRGDRAGLLAQLAASTRIRKACPSTC